MREALPLARIQDAVLEFLRHRTDAALFGTQAMNAYVDEPRMTQDVDILCTRAPELAEALRLHLNKTFNLAIRVREVPAPRGKGFYISQLRPQNRRLAVVRQVDQLPPAQLVGDMLVLLPEELIARKVITLSRRFEQPKADLDRHDIKLLLLTYPHLKHPDSPVHARLLVNGADASTVAIWREFVQMDISPSEEDTGY